ncbi:hypothetical protein N0V85_005077 [Neurospora sp. IMI 360204]|nr:hypothetical protein N0V85_005077 [Neurospora sp. IMI 360204]
MNEAKCGQNAAKKLLRRTGGDVERAIDLGCGCGTPYLPRGNNNNSNDDDDEWDFTLPRVDDRNTSKLTDDANSNNGSISGLMTPSSSDSKLGLGGDDEFDLEKLVGDIQAGQGCEEIRSRLTRYREHMKPVKLREALNGLILGFPGFFYVVETLNSELLRMWAEYGGDVNITYGSAKPLPLVAYVIALGNSYAADTTGILRTLLGLGASVTGIPKAFYTPLERDIPDDGPSSDELGDLGDEDKKWCTPKVRKRIAASLNFRFEQRYLLHRAAGLNRFSGAKRQMAKLYKAEDLLGVHYFLVGQTAAITYVVDRLLCYLALQIERPIILLFAGPSGHDLLTVDCTNMHSKYDLWGPVKPYAGYKDGSKLNNFLAEHSGRRSIVFLDEFEKMDQEIRNTLLLPFQDELLTPVDCKKTIWIMATNAFDETIHAFCTTHEKVLFDDEPGKEGQKLVQKLSRSIQKESVTKFGAPLSGRISGFIPFLTFSPSEQAAVADRILANFGRDRIKSIKCSDVASKSHMVGDLDLQVRRGYSVCKALATKGYVPELGARSITNTVDDDVRLPVVNEYLDRREEIREDQGKCTFIVGVDEDGEIDVSESPSEGTSGSS